MNKELENIAIQMRESGLQKEFVDQVLLAATNNEGICELMVIWKIFATTEEQAESIAAIQELLDDPAKYAEHQNKINKRIQKKINERN